MGNGKLSMGFLLLQESYKITLLLKYYPLKLFDIASSTLLNYSGPYSLNNKLDIFARLCLI